MAMSAAKHGQNQAFNLCGLDAGAGKELGGAVFEHRHLFSGDIAAGVDHEGNFMELVVLA